MAARRVNPLRSDNIAAMYSSTAIAMIFTSLTGVIAVLIDGIIASRFLGSDVYSGIALLRPFTSVVMLLASFLSTGCSFVCSHQVGMGETRKANEAFNLTSAIGLLFAGLLFFVALEPRLLFLAPFALLALWKVLPDTVIDRFTSIGDTTDHSTSYRVSIWLGTIAMLRDGYWLTGIGPGDGAFNRIYPYYRYHEVVAPHSHNLFLQIVCDAGILALLVFLWLLLRWYRTLGRALWTEEDKISRLMQIAFASGALGFLVQAMTDYSFYNYRVMLLFWAYLALGAASARRSDMDEGGILV